jgi:hypothetical protein
MNYWKIKKNEGAVWKQQYPFDFYVEKEQEHFEMYTYAITEEGSELDKQYDEQFKSNLPF